MIKRKDGRWQEQITLPGMKKPKYFYGKTQKEVKQKMAAWQKDQAGGQTFAACADAWEGWHEKQVSYNGAEAYAAALRRGKEHFQDRKIRDIHPDEIDAYIRHLAGKGYSRRTVQMSLDMFRMIWDYSIVQGWTTVNPCRSVKIPNGLPKGKRDLPTDEQIEKVKAGLFLEFGLFPYMLLYTGMRRGELLALRWEDIDRVRKTINVNKAVYFVGNTPMIKEPKTESGWREIVLLDALAAVLPKEGKGYVFGGEKPLTKTQVRKRWIKWCREAGLETEHGSAITPHQLRHAFATILFDAGIDVKVAQELLGHSSIQVTRDIYTHIRRSRMESTADVLNKYLSGGVCKDNVIELTLADRQGNSSAF